MTNEEALEELDTLLIPRDGVQDRLADAFEMAVEALKKQKTGKWIQDGEVDIDGNIQFHCSNCQRGDTHAKGQKVPFCWWCGARMEEENDTRESR